MRMAVSLHELFVRVRVVRKGNAIGILTLRRDGDATQLHFFSRSRVNIVYFVKWRRKGCTEKVGRAY